MFQLITVLLQSLSAIASDPALGYRGKAIKSVLDLAASAVSHGERGKEALKKLTADVKSMADAGKEPTKDEWTGLSDRSDTAHATIQEWKPPEG